MISAHHHKRPSFLDARSLVFWVGVLLFGYGLTQVGPLFGMVKLDQPAVVALSAVIWGLYALLFSLIIYRLETLQRRSPVTMLGAFLWGAVIVTGIAVGGGNEINEIVAKVLPSDMQDWVPAIAAPLIEEPLKMLGVLALAFIPAVKIDSALDGLYYGLFVGLGFEVTESILYGASAAALADSAVTGVVASFVLRGIVGGLWSHPTYTGITGAGVGYFFGSGASAAKRWLMMFGSLLAAMILHGLFDSPLLQLDNPVLSTVVKGVPAFVLLLVLLRIARKRERDVFERVGGTQIVSDLVSHDELKTLLTKRDRRKARRSLRKTHGFATAHAMRRLQRSQIEFVATVAEDGPDSERALSYATDIAEDRRVLAEVIEESS